MLCSRVQNLLSAYLDSELTGEEMLQIRSHLGRCPDCQREHAALRQIKTLLGAMHGSEPQRPFGPDLYLPASQPSRLRLFGRVYRVDRWLSRLNLMGRTAARTLTQPVTPMTLTGVLGVGILAIALARQPQFPDAVSARVPERVPAEYVLTPDGPALNVVLAPQPDTVALQAAVPPHPRGARHYHSYRPTGYVVIQPGPYPGIGGYPALSTPMPPSGLETAGFSEGYEPTRP